MNHRATRSFCRWTLVATLTIAYASGCGGGDGLQRMPIDGTVTFDGQPLEDGRIQFFPDPGNAEPIMSGAPITSGSYSIAQVDGLVPGTYVVRISSASGEEVAVTGEGDAQMPGLGPIHPIELIPSKYNTESTLTAEVTSSGSNTFDFSLEK
ncbi:hypothetical protein [Tautonia marina]|uniref:hypothetical protein n=1 Tax=Tautonia marina TaxID=2653855 RepID=UPI0012604F8A|nr:hypothetical protein [Tautonia marina]